MSHVYPKHSLQADQPIDLEEVNENFREVVNEVHGSLDEHNFQGSAISKYSFVAPGAMCRVWETSQAVDHQGVDGSQVPGHMAGAIQTGGGVQISNNRQWQSIIAKTVTTGESLIWLMASFQQEPWWSWGETLPGCQYALAVDGSIIYESVVGGLDRSNDATGEGNNRRGHPFACDAVYPVTAGEHTFSLHARMVADTDYTAYSSALDKEGAFSIAFTETGNAGRFYAVYARQLIIVELR